MKNIFIKNNTIGFKLSLASPNLIIKWSLKYINKNYIIGEIIEPFTINFKTGYPVSNGLFCERIFGPLVSWKCRCGVDFTFLKEINRFNSFCNFCGIEINTNNSRRWRMGFINLIVPIAHKWYIKEILPFILNISINEFKALIYYKIFSLIFSKKNLNKKLSQQWIFSKLIFISNWFRQILKDFNILNELLFCKEIYYNLSYSHQKKKIIKKLSILHLFLLNNIFPEWLFLTIIPVIPAGLRPLIKIENKLFVSSMINNLYKIIILRNNRLKRWKALRHILPFFFELIDKQLLQYSIDSLLNIKTNTSTSNSNYFSLQGKIGKFRQFILGKRIDFSGRSVIIPGSDLIYRSIGLPLNISLELFKPLFLTFLKKDSSIITLLRASYITQYNPIILKRILKFIITKEIVLLNRAPTLHRMNIQAFKPYLIESESIKLFPIACTSFNADFDGDQMGLFLILSKIAKKEAKKLLAFDKNIFSPAYLKNMFKLSQNMILGIHTLLNFKGFLFNPIIFSNLNDVLTNYFYNLIKYDYPIWIRFLEKNFNIIFKKYILSTLGRILLEYYLYLF